MNAGAGADTHMLPHIAIAGAAASTIDGATQSQQHAVGNYRPPASDGSEGSKMSCRDVDAAAACGSGRVRIQPIDTRIKLHMKQTQGMSMRSRANFGNTHMMASQPGPVSLSFTKLVESGLTFVEARKQVARATREAHQQFVREGERELATEMSFRDVLERARNAHTLGTATLSNKIERMHRREREQQAREMLEWNVQNVRNRGKKRSRTTPFRGVVTSGSMVETDRVPSGSAGPSAVTGSPKRSNTRELSAGEEEEAQYRRVCPSSSVDGRQQQKKSSYFVDEADRRETHTAEKGNCSHGGKEEGRRERGGGGGGRGRRGGRAGEEGEKEGGGNTKRKGSGAGGRITNDVAFVLRKLYTGGGLDAQQQGWDRMPTDLFNTLTMQLGTLSKVNMPRNSLELLVSLRNPNFSCAHMRSVTEINLSGNKLRELPEEAQRLTSLKTLRLDNNRLSGLPQGLLELTSLTSLGLRHNNFSNLPYRFGDLRCLQTLDMGQNMLKTLPPTMGLLTSLKHLKLDGNNMPHLAIPPPFKNPNRKDISANWVKRWNRDKKKEMWTNGATGEASEGDPTSSSAERSSTASVSANSALVPGTAQYNRRRNALASRGIYEWEAALNASVGKVYYVNNVNFGTAPAMPTCMDRLGDMTNLVTLKLSQNKLRSLPSSICSCHNMEVLEANDNYLERLPAKLGEMKRLKILRLDVNCLSDLPASMVHLERLEELCLTSNFFAHFPEFAMKMSGLKKLLLGNNQLKKLPYSVGFLSSLETLQLYNNPLADPPAELLLMGMETMLWECRRRHWAQIRGPPPAVRVHGFGIQEEKLELQPEFDRKLARCIKIAAKTGELNFMMEGLTQFPMGVFQEEIGRKLKSLRLDSNDFSNATVAFRRTWQDLGKMTHSVSLCNLLVLSLKACKLRRLSDDVADLGCLRELYLESNLILNLPEAFTRLRTLEILDMKKNRLQDCPDRVGTLSRLKRLELDGNRLELLPPSLSQLTKLEVLTLSSNHVYRLPEEMVGMDKLKMLDVNGNMLTHLPAGFGSLRLRSLKLSYNRLETLRPGVFRPALKGTLTQLWLSNNNLLQLPDSLIELSKVKEVQMDSNPFKSPPPELLAEGLATVMQYLRVRIQRTDAMHGLIRKRGFDTRVEALLPEAHGVLRSNTGYLTPADLDDFDKATNRFVNGDFYRHPLSAEDILGIVLELRDTRKKEFYECMVEHLMEQVMFQETLEVFSKHVFCRHTVRPWGRSQGPVGCFEIALSALFEDTPRNAFVEEFRPALWTEAQKTLPRSVFEYSHKALKSGLVFLKSAYGPIAKFEDVTFELCECVDAKTGEEVRHPKGMCVVPGLVVVKIIYTPEEAERRKIEDREVIVAFEKTLKHVRAWLNTKQGQGRVMEENKRRKAAKKFRIGTIDSSTATLKVTLKLKEELLVFAQQRKIQFEEGEPFHFHSLASAEEAIVLVTEAGREVDDIREEVARLELEKTQLLHQLKEKVLETLVQLEANLLDKYCYLSFAKVFKGNRVRALKRGWRRPWDGMDGEDFTEWARSIDCIAADRHERPENVSEYKMMKEPVSDSNADETPADLESRLSWEGTDNMEAFLVPRLVEWKEKRAARVLAGKDLSAAAYEDEGEEGTTATTIITSESDESKDHDGGGAGGGGGGEGDSREGGGGDGGVANNSENGEEGSQLADIFEDESSSGKQMVARRKRKTGNI